MFKISSKNHWRKYLSSDMYVCVCVCARAWERGLKLLLSQARERSVKKTTWIHCYCFSSCMSLLANCWPLCKLSWWSHCLFHFSNLERIWKDLLKLLTYTHFAYVCHILHQMIFHFSTLSSHRLLIIFTISCLHNSDFFMSFMSRSNLTLTNDFQFHLFKSKFFL